PLQLISRFALLTCSQLKHTFETARTHHPRKERKLQVIQQSRFFRLLCACGLVFVPAPAAAFEVSGGVSLGGILAGAKPHFAVSPQAGVSWRMDSGLLFAVHETCNILPAINERG